MTSCQTWASSSHFRHPWSDASAYKRKRCESPVDDETIVIKRRRQCSTLEHGFAYLSIGNPTAIDVPWTPSNETLSFVPVNSSAMDSDMLPPQPVYIVEEPIVPEVNMKSSSWYEPEPDRIVITDLDLFTESDDEREERVNINPVLLECIRGKELGKANSPHPKATSTALVLFRPIPGLERVRKEGVTQAETVDENAMDMEP